MKKKIKLLILASMLTITGCSSFKKASQPVLIEQCKAVAVQKVSGPDPEMMKPKSVVLTLDDGQIKSGQVNKGTFINTLIKNNLSWEKDRQKVDYLQSYIHTLSSEGIIGSSDNSEK